MRTNKGERKTELKEGREERRANVDNNTSMAPKLTENPGAITRPVTTLQMAALEMAFISSSSGRGHDPPPNASKLARGDARSVSILQSLLRSAILEYSMKNKDYIITDFLKWFVKVHFLKWFVHLSPYM